MLYNHQNKKKIDIVVDVYYIEKMNIKYILDKNILYFIFLYGPVPDVIIIIYKYKDIEIGSDRIFF